MLYLGIDVGKTWHEAALLNEADEILWRHRFRSNRSGLQSLAERLGTMDRADLAVGLEATGVYWITLHRWLLDRGIAQVKVLNPLQTKAFRNANLRGSKTDRIDAVSLARLIRWAGRTLSTHVVPEERRAAAREISRLRGEMIRLRAEQLIKLDSMLERLFPEFRQVFPDLGTKSAQAVLARWPTPRLLARTSVAEITAVLQHARRRKTSPALAEELLRQAADSVGVDDPLDASAAAIEALVAHVHHLEEQIERLTSTIWRSRSSIWANGWIRSWSRTPLSQPCCAASRALEPRRRAPGWPRPSRSSSSRTRRAPRSWSPRSASMPSRGSRASTRAR